MCAIPAGPIARRSRSPASAMRGCARCARSATRSRRRSWSPTSEPFWQRAGQNGLAETEWLFGSTWSQGSGVLSLLVPPERFSAFQRGAAGRPRRDRARRPDRAVRRAGAPRPCAMLERLWGVGPVHARVHRQLGARRPRRASARCTARTSRRSTSPAPTTGSPATWRARCGPGAARRARRSARATVFSGYAAQVRVLLV